MSEPHVKDPRLVAAGKATAAKRWGPDGRIVRLDSLDPVTREIVVAIIRARRNAEGGAPPLAGQS